MVSPFVFGLIWVIYMLFPYVLGLDLGVLVSLPLPNYLNYSTIFHGCQIKCTFSFIGINVFLDKRFDLSYNCFCIVGRESHPRRLARSLPDRVRSVDYAGKTMHPPKNSIIT